MFEKLKNALKNEKTRSEFISLVMLIIFITGSFYVGRVSVTENGQEQLQHEREQLKQLQKAAREPVSAPTQRQ